MKFAPTHALAAYRAASRIFVLICNRLWLYALNRHKIPTAAVEWRAMARFASGHYRVYTHWWFTGGLV